MSIFENTLKPEEEIGGFIPGQDGDDIFALEKLDSYAGDLPDFDFKEPAVSDIIKPKKENKVENEVEEAEDEIEEGEDFPGEDDSFMNSPEPPEKKQEPAGWGQDYYEDEDEEDAIADPAAKAASTGLVIEDDELKALLSSELDRTSDRRKMREYTKNLEEEKASKPPSSGNYDSPFGDVPDFIEHPEVLDFEEIKADKPSQYGLKEIDGQSHHKAEAKIDEDNPLADKEDKKKKKRLPLWQIITFSAVAALLLLSGIGWGVYKFMNSELTPAQKKEKELADKKEKDKKKDSKIAAVKPAEPVHAENTQADSGHTEGEATTDAEHTAEDTHGTTNTDAHIATDSHDATTNHAATIDKHSTAPSSGHSATKESSKVSHDVAMGKSAKNNSKHGEPEHLTPKSRRENSSHSTSKKNNKSLRSNNDPTKSIIARKIEVDEKVKPIYSVQIYASPSKDDAEDWMMKLKRLKVGSIRMDTQKVRGELWHRVRFGEFESKEDARNAAIKLGFAQSWIDRIK